MDHRRSYPEGPDENLQEMSNILERLACIIESRSGVDPNTSYVAKLMQCGENAILKKVGEEATEAVMAGKDGKRDRIVAETADLWFHCLIMLAFYKLKPSDVLSELERREGLSGLAEKAGRADSGQGTVEGN